MLAAPERTSRNRWWLVVHLAMLAADAILIYLAVALAYWMRYIEQIGPQVPMESFRPLEDFRPLIISLMIILPIIFEFKGLYRLPRRRSWLDQVGIIISGTTMGMAVVIIGGAFFREYFFFFLFSRLIFVYIWLNIMALLALFRLVARLVLFWAWSRGIGLRRVLVVGGTGLAQQIMEAMVAEGVVGFDMLGYLDDPEEHNASQRAKLARFSRLGNLEQLEQLVRDLRVDQVIIALPFWAHHRLPSLVSACRQLGIDFALAPDLYEVSFDRVMIDQLSWIPLLSVNKTVIRGWNLALKRALDVLLIVLAAPLWVPVWLICALLIKLDSPNGPVIFSQVRVGKNGKEFMVYKFRTMIPNAEELKEQLMEQNEADGPLFKMKEDPRVTRVGKFLRKSSLDELPQLINIVRGEMSIVGPRPAVPKEVAQYSPWHLRRLEVTPGLTGLWQVRGRSDTSFDEMVRLDIYYSEHWSLWLDVRIMIQTIPAVLAGRGAY